MKNIGFHYRVGILRLDPGEGTCLVPVTLPMDVLPAIEARDILKDEHPSACIMTYCANCGAGVYQCKCEQSVYHAG